MKPSMIFRRAGLPAALFAIAALAAPQTATAQDEEEPAPPAADLTGAWVLTVETPNGTGTREVTFVQKDGKLTGTISSSMASGTIEGTIEGDKIGFTAVIMMDSGGFELWYEATWVDGELKEGFLDMGDYGSGTFTGKRKEGDTLHRG